MVERQLPKLNVAGSNPVSRSIVVADFVSFATTFFVKVVGSLTPSLLLSAKGHARLTGPVVNALAAIRCQPFAGGVSLSLTTTAMGDLFCFAITLPTEADCCNAVGLFCSL